MKKLMSLLFAGVAIVAMSGCSSTVKDSHIEEVDINVLNEGYLVTGVDGVIVPAGALNVTPAAHRPEWGEIASIQFCPNHIAYVLWRDNHQTIENYSILDNNTKLYFSTTGSGTTNFEINTDEDGTSGKLEVGNTYTIVNRSTEWIIADIEATTVGCPEDEG